jgi:hypothetical protein
VSAMWEGGSRVSAGLRVRWEHDEIYFRA